MKLCHNVKVSVFCKEEEDEAKVKDTLLSLFHFEIQKQLTVKIADTFFNRKIKIFEVLLEKNKEVNEFLESLSLNLNTEQKELLVKQVDSRLDEDLNFYLRLDKDKLLNEGRYWITDSGNCYHIKMSLAAYPRKKEKGKEIVEEIFKQ